jgi:hypothetical protein
MLIGWSSPEDVTETTRRHLADLAALRAERDALAEALREAIDFASEGWGYASDYFRDKWMYEERIAALRAATPSSPRTAGDDHAE